MPKQRFGLGRGLDALIPSGALSGSLPATAAFSGAPAPYSDDDMVIDGDLTSSPMFEIPCDAIALNPQQPRIRVGEEDADLLELANSIREYGLLQPVLVMVAGTSSTGEPIYQLIAGERRLRAAQLAGRERVPAILYEATPQLQLEMALVENLQRTDLNPLDEARGFQTLLDEYHLTKEEIATRVGRDRSTVANKIRLLQLPAEVQEYLLTMPQVFTEGHARAILGVPSDAERILLAKLVVAKRMSVRETEERVRQYNEAAIRLAPDRRGSAARDQSYEVRALEEEFTRAVEMKVRLARSARGKGSLTLYFTNAEQLQLLYARLVGGQPTLNGSNGFIDPSGSVLDNTYDDFALTAEGDTEEAEG